jgi:hypothetical protein
VTVCQWCRKPIPGLVTEEQRKRRRYCLGCAHDRRIAMRTQGGGAAATAMVNAAVLVGLLPRVRGGNIACTDCGKPATEYDHRDYGKPLDVQPVCHSCNIKRGPAKWKVAA